MAGPLDGVKIIEMAGLGAAPFCAMLLADMGAEVLRIEQKPGSDRAPLQLTRERRHDVLLRGRRVLAIDLKRPGAADVVLDLIAAADALVEGFRPGVMERLGLGPDACLARQPALVYGRLTGWGQTGPLAHTAGHDLDYIAISGALHGIGPETQPAIPLNLFGDFGGGGLLLGFGIVCALLEARRSGTGQVVDAAMSDGAAVLAAMMYGLHAAGTWSNERCDNLLDGGAPFYGVYACADGKFIALAPIETAFYERFLERANITDADFKPPVDRQRWRGLRVKLERLFKSRTRDAWCELFRDTDGCVAPVLDWDEAPRHPHNAARRTFIDIAGVTQPAPAPRFSRTTPETPCPPSQPADARTLLAESGIEAARLDQLERDGAI